MGEPTEETYDPPTGKAGNLLTLTMNVPFTAQYLSGDELNQFAETVMNASEPDGFNPVPNTLSYSLVGTPTLDGTGASRFNLLIERTTIHQIDLNQVNAMARGIPLKTAPGVLEAKLPLAALPEIDMIPSWWPWLPLIPFRITVQ